MSLMQQIRATAVPRGSVGIWWVGQNGFIFKSPEGAILSTDLYLTDSCASLHPELNLSRQAPVVLPPEEVDVDLFACTHSHQDHADPETIRRLRNKDTALFLGPCQACGVFTASGIEDSRIRLTFPKHVTEFRDIRVTGMFALPTDDTDLNHMGFLLEFGDGPSIYMTGDTAWTELLAQAASRFAPDILITVINGGFANLSHWQAALLAAEVRPKLAIPCHYDMFPDNSVDPKQFRSALQIKAPAVAYQELQHGSLFLYGP